MIMPPATRGNQRHPGVRGQARGLHPPGPHAEKEQQNGDLDHHDIGLCLAHQPGAGHVQHGGRDDGQAHHAMAQHEAVVPGEEGHGVGPEGVGVEGEHDHVGEPQEHVERPHVHGATEGLVQEDHRAPWPGVAHRETRVGRGRHQGHQPGQGEGQRRPALGQFHAQAQHGEDAAAHHAAHTNGDRTPEAHLVLCVRNHASPLVDRRKPRPGGRRHNTAAMLLQSAPV